MTPKAWSKEEENYKLNFTGTDNFCFVKDTFTWIKWQAIDCKKTIYKSCFWLKKKKNLHRKNTRAFETPQQENEQCKKQMAKVQQKCLRKGYVDNK